MSDELPWKDIALQATPVVIDALKPIAAHILYTWSWNKFYIAAMSSPATAALRSDEVVIFAREMADALVKEQMSRTDQSVELHTGLIQRLEDELEKVKAEKPQERTHEH